MAHASNEKPEDEEYGFAHRLWLCFLRATSTQMVVARWRKSGTKSMKDFGRKKTFFPFFFSLNKIVLRVPLLKFGRNAHRFVSKDLPVKPTRRACARAHRYQTEEKGKKAIGQPI